MKSNGWWHAAMKEHHHRRHHHRHHGRLPFSVWLGINRTLVFLPPNQETFILSQLHDDQVDNLSIQAVDAKGNIVSPVAFDSPPTWTNSDDTAATVAASADGTTAVVTPVKVGGTTTVSVSASIAGTVFTASTQITVVTGAVAGISIVETFGAPPAAAPAPTPAPAPAPAAPTS